MDEDPDGDDEFDTCSDEEGEEGSESDDKGFGEVAAVVDEFSDDGSDEGSEDDSDGTGEESDEDADGGSDGSGAGASEASGHPGGEEIVGETDGDADGEPDPECGGAHLRIGSEIGAEEASVGEESSGEDGNEASCDAEDREDECAYRKQNIHGRVGSQPETKIGI